MKEFLLDLKSHPLWDEFEHFLIEQRPIVPSYDPIEKNTSEWKYSCAKREGFDLALKHLKIEVEK